MLSADEVFTYQLVVKQSRKLFWGHLVVKTGSNSESVQIPLFLDKIIFKKDNNAIPSILNRLFFCLFFISVQN